MRILRALLFIPPFFLIWTEHEWLAAATLAVVTAMGWYSNLQLRYQDEEKPYYQLWLNFVDGLLSFGVMVVILVRNLYKEYEFPWILTVGCIALLARVVAHALYGLSVVREGKPVRRGFWSKTATLSITLTEMIYVLDLEHYQQISMVMSLLLMAASGSAFLYWFYRDSDHRQPLSVASQLTMSRIVLTPFFIWIFFYDNDLIYQNNNLIFKSLALLMVIGFMVTDFLDGHLARKWGEVSTLGKYLDPFSDKISNMTIFLCFLASGYAEIWMVALIYFREASIETLRTLAASQNVVMPARRSGKWKTAIQGAGILIVLAGALDFWSLIIPNWDFIWRYLPDAVMGIITAITLLSGLDYFIASKRILQKYV
ncbi:MAG TPA: CDP-diacylglycerol--glycerol-3-phosphate 3-phosphatidyltransferase [Fibrobacteraceae bacterium]|nr:CDP-diacylglycerol--glycerol-3-phosphate 3-phosphatidyltransferase [Fibrobacteraceae bacterium]